MTHRHVFRFIQTSNTTVLWKAEDISTLLVAVASATSVVPIISTWRLVSVTLRGCSNSGAGNAFIAGSTLRWATGATAIVEDAKETVREPITTGFEGTTVTVLRPPRLSALGFWHDNVTTGDFFVSVCANGAQGVVDIALEFTLACQTGRVLTTVTSASTNAPLAQRAVSSSVAPVGYFGYVP